VGVEGTDARTLLLTAGQGQKAVELTFTELGSELYLVASDPTAAWARESVRAPVTILWPDGTEEVRIGELVWEAEKAAQVLEMFRRKYGDAAWERFYQGRSRILRLRPATDPRPPRFEDIVRAEFDSLAERYTERVEQNPFAKYIRLRSAERFGRAFGGHDPILELGPGTGIETLELLRAGHRVIAVDISPRMIELLHHRAVEAKLDSRLETRVGSIGQLPSILHDLPSGSIGGVLSTFGALNLDPHLDRLPAELTRLVRPGAVFFAGILNRFALTTVAYLLTAGHPRDALRRMRYPNEGGHLLSSFEVWPYWSRQFAHRFRPGFVLESIEAATILAPPFWSAALYTFWGARGRRSLSRLDGRLVSLFPFREMGEYTFVSLRRVG
jgi:SAM-dependent methyltransferase